MISACATCYPTAACLLLTLRVPTQNMLTNLQNCLVFRLYTFLGNWEQKGRKVCLVNSFHILFTLADTTPGPWRGRAIIIYDNRPSSEVSICMDKLPNQQIASTQLLHSTHCQISRLGVQELMRTIVITEPLKAFSRFIIAALASWELSLGTGVWWQQSHLVTSNVTIKYSYYSPVLA